MKKLIVILSTTLLALVVGTTPAAYAGTHTDSRKWSPPLLYHGGPVMVKVKNYLVFWNGGDKNAFDSKYVSLLKRWQEDARHITVFKSTMQYTQADGKHPTDTSYAATYTNTSSFPGKGACAKKCVGQPDIERIAVETAKAHKIKLGLGTIVHVYTPKDIQKCNYLTDSNTQCYDDNEGPDHNGQCGYHNHVKVGKDDLIFAYVPYPQQYCYRSDGSQRFPNNLAADAAISLTSHFQMEAITDPLYTSWYDNQDEGYAENGAECEWVFGPTLPGKKGNSDYNGHTYDVQAEASNEKEGCVVGSRVDGF